MLNKIKQTTLISSIALIFATGALRSSSYEYCMHTCPRLGPQADRSVVFYIRRQNSVGYYLHVDGERGTLYSAHIYGGRIGIGSWIGILQGGAADLIGSEFIIEHDRILELTFVSGEFIFPRQIGLYLSSVGREDYVSRAIYMLANKSSAFPGFDDVKNRCKEISAQLGYKSTTKCSFSSRNESVIVLIHEPAADGLQRRIVFTPASTESVLVCIECVFPGGPHSRELSKAASSAIGDNPTDTQLATLLKRLTSK